MSSVKILRLNNATSNPKLTIDTDKAGFKFNLDQDLINLGRCLVEVISGWSQITQQTLNAGAVNATERIIPNNIPQLVIRSNIIQEGEDTLTGGGGMILGTMSLVNTNGTQSESTNSGFFNQNDSLSFVCNQLPSQIHIERMYYTDDPADAGSIPSLRSADNINPAQLLPCEVVLKLTFIDM